MARRYISVAALGKGTANAPPGSGESHDGEIATFGDNQSTAGIVAFGLGHAERKAWLRVQAQLLLFGLQADLTSGDDGQPLLLLIATCCGQTRSFINIAETQVRKARVGGHHE